MPDFSTPTPQGLMDLAWATLLHSTWLGLLAGSLASSLIALGRPGSPRARHAAIVASLLLATIAAPAAAVAQRALERRDLTSSFVVLTTAPDDSPERTPEGPGEAAEALSPSRPAPAAAWGVRLRVAIAEAASRLDAMRPYLLAAWAAVATAFAAALAVGAAALGRLRREAAPRPALDLRARALGRSLRLHRTPEVREHPRIAEPCLAGVRRPMVLLPSRWLATATADEVDAVLAHELAHARRLDHRTNPLLLALEAAFGFHPGVRLASRLARREAERAADALAVRLTGDPLSLARALESVARSSPSRPRLIRLGLAVGGDRSALLPRIQELLGMKPARPRFPFRVVPSVPIAAALAWLAISASPAQEPAPAGPAPAVSPGPGLPAPPDDPAEAEWLAKVQAVRARIEAPESQEHAMGVLLRLIPGNPRLPKASEDVPRPRAELAPEDIPEDVLIRLASKRPWRLTHQDLVTLARTFPHGQGDASKLSREALLRIADPNQVSLEVTFLQLRNESEKLPAEAEEDRSNLAQVAPPIVLGPLIAMSQQQFPGATLQAPKVTTWEGASATICVADETTIEPKPKNAPGMDADRTPDVRLAARLDGPLRGDEGRMLVTGRLRGRLEVKITAIRKSWGHAVEVRLHGSIPGDAEEPAVLKTVERLARINVWEGDSILLDSGIDVYAAGVAPPGPHVRTLVAITPRHLPNQEEQEALNGPVADFAAAPTASR